MENTEKGIVITKTFNAPRELVWKAWTEPELIMKWWGPEGFTSPSAKIDFQVGGKYTLAMHGPVGSEWDRDMFTSGIYKEIVPYEKIVASDYFSDSEGNMISPDKEGQDSSFPKELLTTILFEEIEPNKTKLSIVYPKPETKEQMEAMLKSGMEEGWSTSLNKLAVAIQK